MIIQAKITTKAKRNYVQQINDLEFKIFTTAAPEKGIANKKIIELLSEYLKTTKSKLKIISGDTSRIKKIEVN